MRNTGKIFLILLLVLNSQLWSRELRFREVPIPEAVRTNVLDLVFTDNDGFLWLAARSNLYWYDGIDFNEIRTDTTGRPDDIITTFYHDRSGKIWLGWRSGHISNISGDSTIAYTSEEGNPSAPIVGWAEDSKKQLWMTTDGEGVYVLASDKRWYNFNTGDGLPSNETYGLVGNDANVVVATDQGVVKLSFDSGKKEVDIYGLEQGLSDQIAKTILKDKDQIYVGYYEPWINVLSEDLSMIKEIEAPGSDNHMFLRNGNTSWWLSEAGHLFSRIGDGDWRRVILDPSQRIRVRHLAIDHEGHIWVATEKGLFMLDLWYEHFNTDKPVTAVCTDGDKIWFAQDGDLYFNERKNGAIQKLWEGEKSILTIHVDPDGKVWSGTFDTGIIIWDPVTKTTTQLNTANGLINDNVLSIDGDERGVWVGTLGGAGFYAYHDGIEKWKPRNFDRSGNMELQYIYAVHVAHDGMVYLATDGDGVLKWDGEQFLALSEQVVMDVTTDEFGNVWWVTSVGQLYRWNETEGTKEIQPFTQETGNVSGLKIAPGGDVLVFHDKGIHRWVREQEQWTYYGRSFGLGQLQPELHSQVIGADNILFIGNARGITCINLSLLRSIPKPLTQLDRIDLYLEPTSQTTFRYNQNHISFRYTGLWYTDPDRVKYKIKLSGYDLDWSISQNNSVTYPRLDPGEYEFFVVAGIDGQFPEDDIKSISISISKPWYSRWYVIVVLVLFLILIAYLAIRARLNMIQHEQKRDQEKVRAQYEAIKSQVNPHFLFNSFNTLMAMIEDDRDEAITYLENLSDFFRHILQFREIDLYTLQEELDVVKSYLELQDKRFGDALKINIEVGDEYLQTLVPPLTLQLLIENAFKHNIASRSRPLEVEIAVRDGKIVVWNKLQEKSQRTPSTGYGLDSIRKKYLLYTREKVSYNKEDDKFIVYLPIIKDL